LYRWAERILSDGVGAPQPIPFLKGSGEVAWYEGETSARVEANVRNKIRLIPGSVEAPPLTGARFDLVTALNVLDQCAYPSRLAHDVLTLVAPQGYAALSCAHQFQPRFYVDPSTVFESLHDLFDTVEWALRAETELSFEFRMGERHRNRFLSHHVLYQRVA
jgi:hypothetical protein